MLTLIIPSSISMHERREALRLAKADVRRHQIIMQYTAKRADLGAFRHAKTLLDKANQACKAWESVQISGATA